MMFSPNFSRGSDICTRWLFFQFDFFTLILKVIYLELLICWKPEYNEDNEQNFEQKLYISKRFIYLCQVTQMGIYLFLEMFTSTCVPIDVNILEFNALLYQTCA